MSTGRLFRSIPLLFALSLFVGLSGCSVFSTVGGWFSQGYDNTVAYFNAYYNAKKLFDEAEAEVFAAQATARGKTVPGSTAAPIAPPKQKFTQVIDKCSNILAFSPQSNIVDDALFLIGKSFYYQEDYLKAERKFTELVAQFPGGPLELEGQMWLLKTLLKLNRYDDGMRVGQSLVDAATAAEEDDIAAEVLATLGEFSVTQSKTDVAIDFYSRSVAQATSGEFQAATQTKIGDLLFDGENYERAIAAYREVETFSPDDYTLFYSQLREAIAYRILKRYDDAFALFKKLESDFRFLEYRNMIWLEYGATLVEADQIDDAVATYKLVDSVYTRTPAGAKAAFELGALLQHRVGEYPGARLAYSHAVTGGDAELGKEAQRRVSVFDRLFALRTKLFDADSILAVYDVDSVWIVNDTVPKPAPAPASAPVTARSRRQVEEDTSETLEAVKPEVRVPDSTRLPGADGLRRIPKPSKDTLFASIKTFSFEIGELFATELDAPDSAYSWLHRAIDLGLDSVRAPRALFALAGIAAITKDSTYGDAKGIYQTIIEKYPLSNAAEESRIALGFGPTPKKEDMAKRLFMSAESLMYAGKPQEAIDTLDVIQREYGSSPLMPQASYLKAWIYEHDLSKPDSAIAQYKMISNRFGASLYGAAAMKRVPPVVVDSAKPAVKDSLAATKVLTPSNTVPDTAARRETSELKKSAVDSSMTRPRTLRMLDDSLKIRTIAPDSVLTPSESDTSRTNRRKLEKER